jgi:hypothetical protein
MASSLTRPARPSSDPRLPGRPRIGLTGEVLQPVLDDRPSQELEAMAYLLNAVVLGTPQVNTTLLVGSPTTPASL